MGEQKVISYSLIKQKFKSREDQKIIKTAELENRI